MYAFVLVTHSWLRYAVLALGVALLVVGVLGVRKEGTTWTLRAERLHTAFLGVLDTQLLLGLLLYFWLSPITSAAFSDFGAAMKVAPLRFFGVEHIFAMLLAIVAAHVGRTRSKRREGTARYRAVLIAQLVWLVLTLAAIPWPALDVGRPLFRL